MSNQAPDLSTLRHIRDARDVGCAENGQRVTLHLAMEDGQTEWLAIHQARVGRLVAAILFGAAAAARDRATVAADGKPVPELSTLLDITRINASSAPGADHVALRVVVGEGVNLDFRVPLGVVPALQDKLAQALAAARGT